MVLRCRDRCGCFDGSMVRVVPSRTLDRAEACIAVSDVGGCSWVRRAGSACVGLCWALAACVACVVRVVLQRGDCDG